MTSYEEKVDLKNKIISPAYKGSMPMWINKFVERRIALKIYWLPQIVCKYVKFLLSCIYWVRPSCWVNSSNKVYRYWFFILWMCIYNMICTSKVKHTYIHYTEQQSTSQVIRYIFQYLRYLGCIIIIFTT